MKRGSPIRTRAVGLMLCALLLSAGTLAGAQTKADQTLVPQLLGKAHALEVRGRMDMAKQMWEQVLLVDQNNSDALAGMARAAKLAGDEAEYQKNLNKLKANNPNDPNIARVENMGTAQDPQAQLAEAGHAAQAGQYARAMTILRQVYGDNPPAGDAALSYYQTEAATDDGRPHAIAGLRALMDKYPQDSRYQVALGKILTYNPRTRAEGRKLLQRHPNDPEAAEALKQSLLWDASNPATSADIRAYLSKHKDEQLSSALATTTAANRGRKPGRTLTPDEQAAQVAYAARSKEEQEAYNALNAHHIDDAEARFKVILAKNDKDWQALAGLGYVRMNQSNFGGAISYFEQAKQDGGVDAAVEKALADSRFYFTMQTATAALNQSDLVTAQQQFTAALTMRPNDPTALLGLGGTLLKAQQPDAALPVFVQYVKLQPGDKAAWRGLFMAQYGAGKYNDALATDKRIPPKVKAELLKDPDYLRTLASVYLALGRDADAQRVLKSALDLPFPEGGKGLKEDMQTQFAALLVTANHKEQAAGLYRQVLAEDQANTNAWAGLIQVDHQLGKDPEAYQLLQTMPPVNYQQAMQEPGFETTVAAIYEGQGHDDMAQDVLEKFMAKQQAEGRKPFVPAQVQLAGIYLRRGDSVHAYPLYQSILVNNPGRSDAWKGLLAAMHSTGHDQEALAELQTIPPDVRRDLENDPQYLQTVGSIYAGLGHPQEAMMFLSRAQQHYLAAHVTPPADIDIQNAWLLYNTHTPYGDAQLYPLLMTVGGREDLTDQQRLTVQTIWANWAVRRANEAAARRNYKLAIAILNAAAKAFPGNPDVIKALASGYATAGMPKEAVAIFKSEDLTHASAADYKAAVGAALAANDTKDAETWLRFGLDQYPRDSQMLTLAARFEMAIGNSNRAAEYYRAALATMPAADPGSELAGTLAQPSQGVPAQLPSRRLQQPADLATLLSQPDTSVPLNANGSEQPVAVRPYLPSYNGPAVNVPVQIAPGSQVPLNGTGNYPNYANPQGTMPAAPPQTAPKNSTLKDYVPQSRLEGVPTAGVKSDTVVVAGVRVLHQSAATEAKYGPYRSFLPGGGASSEAEAEALLREPIRTADSMQVHIVQAAFTGQQQTMQDGTPIVGYAPVAKPQAGTPAPQAKPVVKKRVMTPQQIAAAKARAAAIHANQADAPALTGVSHPPQENYDTPQMDSRITNAQYSTQQPTGQVPQPTNGSRQQAAPIQVQPNSVSPATIGQQYPQPRTAGPVQATTGTTRRRKPAPAPAAETPAPAPAPAMTYPTYAQPISNTGFPAIGPAYPIGQAPTDYELQQRSLPPLRGYFDPRVDDKTPLTERDQTMLDLARIEAAYSGWVGGSVIGRYRSGTPGVDRLSSVEIPFEASVVVGQSMRLTVIPNAVFLNSGQLATTATTTDIAPILGTLPLGALYSPQQQFASGIGGEFQLATNTFAAAIGYTPYEFLVSNTIGRVRWKPANGPFTFFGGRDAVKETQLSYAGLRDPGQESATFSGPVWGGVVATGGGVRFDHGDEHAGLYIQGEGAALTGYHTLENRKYDGTMGAYFRVKDWPEYGTLNVGGTLFGEHFNYNERGETYGLGGYFSPEAYFLAAIPLTFNGHSGTNIHYLINGSVGVQTFQEDNQIYFPLDPGIQSQYVALNCTTAQQIATRTCGQQPVNSNTGLNYAIDGEFSYQVNDHWFVGAFISGNNTNNYNTISGGFFGRYTFKPQYPTVESPTGLFPIESTTFRPLRVP